MIATIQDGRVIRLQGDKEHPVTRGFLCHRTSNFLRRQYGPERLTHPLQRTSSGFREIAWDDALDLAAEHLQRIKREDGAAAILHYKSGGTLGTLRVLTQWFFEQWGPVTIKRGDICSGAGDAAQLMDFGAGDTHDLHDLLNARNIILWGKNVFVSHVHALPVLRDARSRGARITLVDPVHTRTTTISDRYIQPRPGADLALVMAIIASISHRGAIAPEAATYCDHLDALVSLAESRDLEQWCAAADVQRAEVEALAACLVDRPCAIMIGWGMQRRVNGGAIVRALDALSAITGNIGVAGGGAFFNASRASAFATSFVQGQRVAPRTLSEPRLGREILDAQSPPIRAVWVTAGNPVAMLPDASATAEALRTREFVVVADSFMTDTAELAHLILPTQTLLEADDLVGAYGHHYLSASSPVVPPPDGVKSDLEIVQLLALRLGLGDVMAGDAQSWKRRLLAPELVALGVTVEGLERAAERNPLAPVVLFPDRQFPTASGRVRLIHEWPEFGDGAPDVPGFPLHLLSRSTDKFQGSQWTEPPNGPLEVTVHPDATTLTHGADAWLESPNGRLHVVVKHDPAQRRDVALVPKGGQRRDGRGLNTLISARLTDIGEGAALYDQRVRLVPHDR